jgi:hypothetical protein
VIAVGRVASVREALIAEALGDFVKVLDRIDAAMPRLDQSCTRLEKTVTVLGGSIDPFQKRVADDAVKMQNKTVAKIGEDAKLIVRTLFDEETKAMTEAARAVFMAEVIPPLRQLTTELQDAVHAAHHPWEGWFLHAATIFATAAVTAVVLDRPPPAKVEALQPTATVEAPAPGPSPSRPERGHGRR